MILSIIISTCFIHNVYSYSLLNTRGGGGGDTLSRTQLIDLVDKTLGFDNNGQINPLPKKDKNTQYQNLLEYIQNVESRLGSNTIDGEYIGQKLMDSLKDRRSIPNYIKNLSERDKSSILENLTNRYGLFGDLKHGDKYIILDNLTNRNGLLGGLEHSHKYIILRNLTNGDGLLGGLDPVHKCTILRNLTNESGLLGNLGDDARKMLRDAIGISDNDLLKFIANNKDQIKKTLEIK